jgi:hypothetical protein
MIQDVIPLIEKASNWITVSKYEDPELRMIKTKFLLGRLVIYYL